MIKYEIIKINKLMADAIKGKNDDRHSIKEVLDKAVCIKHTGYKLTQLCS